MMTKMKLTRRQIKQIIKEEIESISEQSSGYLTYDQARAKIEQVRDPVVQEILRTLLRPSSSMPL